MLMYIRGQLGEVCSHLPPHGSHGWTQAARLGAKHFYPLNHCKGSYFLSLNQGHSVVQAGLDVDP